MADALCDPFKLSKCIWLFSWSSRDEQLPQPQLSISGPVWQLHLSDRVATSHLLVPTYDGWFTKFQHSSAVSSMSQLLNENNCLLHKEMFSIENALRKPVRA
jgi:hypothetical protein